MIKPVSVKSHILIRTINYDKRRFEKTYRARRIFYTVVQTAVER